MTRLGFRWVVLYFLSILLPAALLAFLGVRSLSDVRESVLRELRSKAGLAQDAFDRVMQSRAQLLAAYVEEGGMDPRRYAGFSEIAQIFVVDAAGVLRHPSVRPLNLQEPRAAFAAQMEKAGEREFGRRDLAGAARLYDQAWKEALSPAEEAEALNALSRCALEGKDEVTAEEAHRRLVALHGQVFDADGAHPVTLSHLRLGRHAAPPRAQASLMAWTEALLQGRYPLYAGCGQALQEVRGLAEGRLAEMEDRPDLLERLSLIDEAMDFALNFGPVVEARWAAGRERGYISGAGDDGDEFPHAPGCGRGRRRGGHPLRLGGAHRPGAGAGGGPGGPGVCPRPLRRRRGTRLCGRPSGDDPRDRAGQPLDGPGAGRHLGARHHRGHRVLSTRATGWWGAASSPWPCPWSWAGS